MFWKVFLGGPSSYNVPRLAYHKTREDSPWEANVKACEWPCETFMVNADIKEEFDIFIHNAGLTDFLADKCAQYNYLTYTFVRHFKCISLHQTQCCF